MPSISLVHYPEIYPKFRAVCKKHSCLPTNAGSLFQAIATHWWYIYRLGQGELSSDIISQPATLTKTFGAKADLEGGNGRDEEPKANRADSPVLPPRALSPPKAHPVSPVEV